MSPSPPLPAQTGPQRPQVTERELTPRQRLMPFKQTQSEKDRESQYLSEQAKQAGSPRNVREGGPALGEHYFNRQIFGNRRCPRCGGRGGSSSPQFCPGMDGTRPSREGAGGQGARGGWEVKADSQSQQKSWHTTSLAWKSRFREGRGFEPGHLGHPTGFFLSCRPNCRCLSLGIPCSRPC